MGKVAKGLGNALLLGIPGRLVKGQKRAERAAKAEGANQRQMLEQQQGAIRDEQQRANAQIANTQAKLAAGQARSNRRRIRGGIFGDSLQQESGSGLLNPKLG